MHFYINIFGIRSSKIRIETSQPPYISIYTTTTIIIQGKKKGMVKMDIGVVSGPIKNKVIGYKSENLAAAAAKKRGEFGVRNSGQECGVIVSEAILGFGFKTWDGRVLVPHAILSHREHCKKLGIEGGD